VKSRRTWQKIVAEQANKIAELEKKVERLERRLKKAIEISRETQQGIGRLQPRR